MPRSRLLLVGDHRMIAEAIAEGLAASAGMWVLGRYATDDPRLIQAVASSRPDVVILDVAGRADEMASLVRAIKTAGHGAHIIVLTPTPNAAAAAAAARAGAMALLGTDVTMEGLAQIVDAVQRGHASYPADVLGAVLRELRVDLDRAQTDDGPLGSLSAREREVLLGMMAGKSCGQIARQMFLSANTVRSHSHSILTKLQVHSRLEAVAVARSAGWRGGSSPPLGST